MGADDAPPSHTKSEVRVKGSLTSTGGAKVSDLRPAEDVHQLPFHLCAHVVHTVTHNDQLPPNFGHAFLLRSLHVRIYTYILVRVREARSHHCPGAKLRGPPPLVHTAQGRPREVRVCGQGLCGEGFFLVLGVSRRGAAYYGSKTPAATTLQHAQVLPVPGTPRGLRGSGRTRCRTREPKFRIRQGAGNCRNRPNRYVWWGRAPTSTPPTRHDTTRHDTRYSFCGAWGTWAAAFSVGCLCVVGWRRNGSREIEVLGMGE